MIQSPNIAAHKDFQTTEIPNSISLIYEKIFKSKLRDIKIGIDFCVVTQILTGTTTSIAKSTQLMPHPPIANQ
jgi:hypothetical protein